MTFRIRVAHRHTYQITTVLIIFLPWLIAFTHVLKFIINQILRMLHLSHVSFFKRGKDHVVTLTARYLYLNFLQFILIFLANEVISLLLLTDNESNEPELHTYVLVILSGL